MNIKPLDPAEKKQSSAIIPDTAQGKPQEGEIFTVGQSKVNDDGKKVPMSETKKTKSPVTQVKVEEPEQVETNGNETAWHKAKFVTAKGVTTARFIAGKISRLAGSTAELAKAKIAINKLEVALNKVYHDAGEKVRQLDEQNKLGAIKPHFSEELKKIENLKQQVIEARQNKKKISFSN